MEIKPAVKITLTVADLKHQPGMAIQTDIKAGADKKAAPPRYQAPIGGVKYNQSED